ncbi:MAG: DUF3341 domain-containing protein [Chloroflexi bacterium]|nr:DUF3341 domain-containing protein [Chloroflexota bacterium]
MPALEARTFVRRADTSFKEPTSKAKTRSAEPPLYGLLAEFAEPEALLDRARRTYAAGYRRLAAYTPFPVEGLSQAIGLRQTKLPLLVLLGGIAGAVGGFFLQYYAAVLDYPWNIGGRPFNSWPSFMIVTFEATVLTAAAVTVVGMLVFNKLPMLYHPVFNAPRFKLASRDRFFLCVKATDPQFDVVETRQFLESFGPEEVVAVERRPPKVIKK